MDHPLPNPLGVTREEKLTHPELAVNWNKVRSYQVIFIPRLLPLYHFNSTIHRQCKDFEISAFEVMVEFTA